LHRLSGVIQGLQKGAAVGLNRAEIFRLWLAGHPRQRRLARSMTLADLVELARAQGFELGPDELRAAMDAAEEDFFGPPEKPLFLESLLSWPALLVLALALAAGFLVLDHGRCLRQNQEHINPEAVQAMVLAMEEMRRDPARAALLSRSEQVVALGTCRVFGEEIACVLTQRYALLSAAGVPLPPLYEPGYQVREAYWRQLLGLQD